jgi:hypothetical protein
MFGIGWKHRVARKVMIELLYAEGLRWAGWYRDANLVAQWDRIMGQHNQGAFTQAQRRAWKREEAAKKFYPASRKVSKPGQFVSWQELETWLAR